MTHLGYILAAYGAAAAVLLAMVLWVMLDLRTQRRKLQRLEDDGIIMRPSREDTP